MILKEIGLCKDCRWWYVEGKPRGLHRTCLCPKITDTMAGDIPWATIAPNTAVACESILSTGPEFGCVHFALRAPGKTHAQTNRYY